MLSCWNVVSAEQVFNRYRVLRVQDLRGLVILAAQAFPAKDARERTTYMFTYLDADESRPSLQAMMELYWRAMPQYQVGCLGVNLRLSCRLCLAPFPSPARRTLDSSTGSS